MNLPLTIIDGLPPTTKEKWQQQFVATDRVRHEGVWRRTQEPKTQAYSGYSQPGDARWKLVHFLDEYNLVPGENGQRLVIEKPYLWLNTALPADEMAAYYQEVLDAMSQGGWSTATQDQGVTARRGDLIADLRWMPKEEAERRGDRPLPDGYKVLDVEIYGPSQPLSDEERGRPWNIFRGGIRKPLSKGAPTVIGPEDAFDLSQYAPFHLEMGCGPSIEAGVPPLSHLHKTYAISNPKTHHFLIGKEDDLLRRFFADPEGFYAAASLIYASALKAEPTTLFYREMKRLYDEGVVLSPVYTNNYDGLIADIGLPEHYLRKFDDSHLFPDVQFDDRAKALVVVGSHADRRKLQEKARTSGLQVIYVDPEIYEDDKDHKSYHYGIESPQDDDILLQMSAQVFAEKLLADI